MKTSGKTFQWCSCWLLGAAFLWPALSVRAAEPTLPVCLYVSSYHQGYPWSDGIEQGIRTELEGLCHIVQFDMDTKRQRDTESIKSAALHAWSLVETLQPAVVITSDDHAVKHFVVPYLKDTAVPVVFSGVNWTVEEYGFPVENVTGIVEVMPIRPLLTQARRLAKGNRVGTFIGSRTLSERKNFHHIQAAAVAMGVFLEVRLVNTMQQWISAMEGAQSTGFVILGANAGIDGWDHEAAINLTKQSVVRPVLVYDKWMMPYAHLGFTKFSAEQGHWAGQTAGAILRGIHPSDLPIVTNRKWDIWVNEPLLDASGLLVSPRLKRKAKRIE